MITTVNRLHPGSGSAGGFIIFGPSGDGAKRDSRYLVVKKGCFYQYIGTFNDCADLDCFVDLSSLLKHRLAFYLLILH